METKFLIGIILLVLTLGAGGVYFAKSNGLLATGFTPVYCNDFEFTCCNEQKISEVPSQVKMIRATSSLVTGLQIIVVCSIADMWALSSARHLLFPAAFSTMAFL